MNQEKIGKFIAQCRKEKGYTQSALAEKLGITDRAVSKWETGRSVPDASIMLELCKNLDINVNELLTGERIEMEDYKEKAEQTMLELKRMEEKKNRALLDSERWLFVLAGYLLFTCLDTFFRHQKFEWYTKELISADWLKNLLSYSCLVLGLLAVFLCILHILVIELRAGYYQCSNCNEIYDPDWKKSLRAIPIKRSKKLVCPKCGKKCWHKKVLTK